MYEVMNVPSYAYGKAWWVVRMVDGVLWFYGAWNDKGDAVDAALTLDNSAVLATEDCA